MHPHAFPPIPAETQRVARAVFRNGNPIMRIADEWGVLLSDHDLTTLFPAVGQLALSPSRLLMITLFQFIEGLTDRQAADAVRRCIDWKYALALELTDLGFDASVLSEFRTRLLAHDHGVVLLDRFIATCRERGLVKARGTQRTDGTHVLAAVRTLNRLECLGETVASTLQQLLSDAPEWARQTIPSAWWTRYQQRFDSFRLPNTAPQRHARMVEIGTDGRQLLTWVDTATTPDVVRQHPAVAVLRQVWMQQFDADPAAVRLREVADLPPGASLIGSPYDPDARQSTKRGMTWTGYKVHLTETCDPALPHLITDVQTTPATTGDVAVTGRVQAALAAREVLPAVHLVDAGYPDADQLVDSQRQGIDLVGPVHRDTSWQATQGAGFDLSTFQVDWDAQQVRCPQGHTSRVWSRSHDATGNAVIHIRFDHATCGACPERVRCTHAKTGPRTLKLRPQAEHQALQAARTRQTTPEFKRRYAKRAGVEGTVSQAVHGFDVRRTRYRGLAKTALQHIFVVLAINFTRLVAWWEARPRAQTRTSRFSSAFAHAGWSPTT